MLVFVVYDISEDSSRNHLIKLLRHYGLYRIQKSVFAGYLDLENRLDLADKFELYISSDNDNIVLIPACKNCEESIIIEGFTELPEKKDFDFV